MRCFGIFLGWASILSQMLFGFSFETSLVKVYVTQNIYNYYSPWNPPRQGSGTGSGFIIEGNQILTSAHVVANAAFIQVKKNHDVIRYPASIQWIAHDCDLALLAVDDSLFWEGVSPLQIREEMAELQDEVFVYGFPIGGEELSITKGIISRTEVRKYLHGGVSLLSSQIDAALNAGNSGGPVVSGGEVVGVVHQGSCFGSGIGYMVPVPIIRHFLIENSHGKYEGFPDAGIVIQTMENPALRKFYRMSSTQSGVLLVNICEHSPLFDFLLSGDILLSIDGYSIANDGSVFFEEGHRFSFTHLFSIKFFGETLALQVLRKGEVEELSIPLYRNCLSELIVPAKRPNYFIFGGILFQPLNRDYLDFWLERKQTPPSNLTYYIQFCQPSLKDKQMIVISRVLPAIINMGYQNLFNQVVHEVNGREVRNLIDLIDTLETWEGDFHQIVTKEGSEIILDRMGVKRTREEVLKQYQIPSDRFIDKDHTVSKKE
jgi:S1-C subfamily serine protease